MQLPESIPVTQPRHRSAGFAFLISLIIPGSGQVYCGKLHRGISTFLFVLLAAVGALAFNTDSSWWGTSLRSFLALYVFSFLDAYYTARELDAGKDVPPYQNPRVAAALNFLTNGFGYFYLGERAKGLIVFMAMRLVGFVFESVQWLWEIVILALAIDAYRIGRRELARGKASPLLASSGVLQLGLTEKYVPAPATAEQIVQLPSSGGSRLPPGVPLAFAALIACLYAGLVVLGSIMPDYRVLDQSQVAFQQTGEEKIYSNPGYGVEFHVPVQWNFDFSDRGSLIQASSADGVCRAGLLIDAMSPFLGLESARDSVVGKVLSQDANFRMVGQRTSQLGVHPAYEITISQNLGDDELLTRYILARKGMTLYTLVFSNRARFDEDCRRLADVIRLRLVLPMD